MSDVAEYLASRLRSLTPEKWDAFVRSLDQRFRVLEEQLGIERRVTDQILQRGLQVIEDGIGPAIVEAELAAANISAMSDLGLVFFATSKTSLAVNANPKTLTIPAGNRAQFAPALYVAVFASGSRENGFVGRRISYDRTTGILNLAVEQTFGSGTFDDWEVGPIATTADLEALRDQVTADRAAVQQLRDNANTFAGQAAGSAGDANTAKNGAQGALTAFKEIWYGPLDVEPAGAALGSQFLDTSQTPNVVKVLTEDGWAPTVTVSVGGARQQIYTATEGQTGPFVVDGGFSIGSVNLNGVEFFHENGITLDPVAGSFTFGQPLVAGDLVVFRGYLANDAIDIYTKSEANSRFVRHDGEQELTPAEKAQARANISALEATSAAVEAVLGGTPALSDAKVAFNWDEGFALTVNETYFASNWPINIGGTAAVATTANYAGSAGNASQLGGMPPSHYTAIEARFGYSIPRILSTQDARIYFGWAGGTLNLQVDGAAYYGPNWPINITGTSNYANSAGSVPAAHIMNTVAAAVIATPGTRAFAVHVGTGAVTPGAVVAGSAIRWCSADGQPVTGDWLPGNWICEGHIANGATGIGRATGFKRYN